MLVAAGFEPSTLRPRTSLISAEPKIFAQNFRPIFSAVMTKQNSSFVLRSPKKNRNRKNRREWVFFEVATPFFLLKGSEAQVAAKNRIKSKVATSLIDRQ